MAKKTQTKFLKRKQSFQLWQVIVFVAIFAGVGIFAIIASAAPKNNSTHSSATLQVSPNPAPAATTVHLTITGCGYTPGANETLIADTGIGQWAVGAGLADSKGCINTVTGDISTGSPGSQLLQIRERNPKNGKNTIVSSTTWVFE